MPNGKHELIERMNNVPRLSKGQRRISAYILENYEKAAFMTAYKLGEATGVSESTIVRFAMALGYEGYPEMQKAVQDMVRTRLTAAQRVEITANPSAGNVLSTILRTDMNNLRLLLDSDQTSEFITVRDALLSAHRIYIIGLRASSQLAGFFGYYLNYIFEDVHVITQGGSEVREQLARIGPGDVILGISFPRYSNRTIESMRFARSQGAMTIAVTDSVSSPLFELADHCLTARSSMASFVDSIVAPMSLLNALIVALGMEKKQELAAYFGKLEIIWNDTAIYSGVSDTEDRK